MMATAAVLDFSTPHVLRNTREYKAAVAEIDHLLDAAPKRGTAASDRLEFLSVLVEAYETEHDPIDERSGTPQSVVAFMLARRSATLAGALLLAVFGLPDLAAAQLAIRVVSLGAAVPIAEVSAWSQSERLAHGVTDYAGVARLILPVRHAPATFVTVRRLGFAPARAVLGAEAATSGDTLTISMEPVSAELPALVVRDRRPRCPSESERAAEDLWRRVASRYSAGWEQLFFGYNEDVVEGEIVSPEARGFGDTPAHRRRVIAAPSEMHRQLLASPPPYAAYERHVNMFGEYWKWRYAALHQYVAGHFTTDAFRLRHVLSIADTSDAGTVIAFCPRQDDETTIRGELLVGPDSLFKSGRWEYMVSHDGGDDAGAEAVFGTTSFEGGTYLVAVQGSMWRRDGRQNYSQDRFSLRHWSFGSSPSQVMVESRERAATTAAAERPTCGVARAGTPCHFVFLNRSHARITEPWFVNAAGITGAQLKYTWRELEPERDRYDFSSILGDVDILRRQNRRLFVQLQDVSFDSATVNVPEYLLADTAFHGGVLPQMTGNDPRTAKHGGWVARRWDAAVRARFHRLLDTLGHALDGQIEGITLPETALDVAPSGPLRPRDYSDALYRDAIVDNMRALRRAFPRSTAMLYGNFMPGESLPDRDHGYLRSVYATAREIGLAMGGPDLLPHRYYQMVHSYGMLRDLRGVVPTGLAVQDGNYGIVDRTTGRPVTVQEQYAFAACWMGVSYIFWQTAEPWFTRDVLPFIARERATGCASPAP